MKIEKILTLILLIMKIMIMYVNEVDNDVSVHLFLLSILLKCRKEKEEKK